MTTSPDRPPMPRAVILILVIASLLASCGSGVEEAAYDTDGGLVCPDLPESPEPLPQIYVLDLEDPELLAELHGIDDAQGLSIVRRDVIDRTAVHIGWHRGGVVAPVRVWSRLSGVDAASLFVPEAVHGLRTTDDPCELDRFDASAGFFDYVGIYGDQQFDVVGASDGFLTTFVGEPRDVTPDGGIVGALIDDFGEDRSTFTNRRNIVLAVGVLVALIALVALKSFGGRRRTRRS